MCEGYRESRFGDSVYFSLQHLNKAMYSKACWGQIKTLKVNFFFFFSPENWVCGTYCTDRKRRCHRLKRLYTGKLVNTTTPWKEYQHYLSTYWQVFEIRPGHSWEVFCPYFLQEHFSSSVRVLVIVGVMMLNQQDCKSVPIQKLFFVLRWSFS